MTTKSKSCLSSLLLLIGVATNGICQDTLRAREIDAIVNIKRKAFHGRLDRISDTTIMYQYDLKTNEFYDVDEYIRLKETRTVYRYSYSHDELIKVSVCHCWRVNRHQQRYADYYFEHGQLIHKEEHGILADKADYFLQRGKMFLENAPRRFFEPRIKDVR
jgi:hypothetical protein